MTNPLVKKLKFNRLTEHWDNILLGMASEVDNIKPNIHEYLKNLCAITRNFTDKASTITMDNYVKEVKQLRETTSYGP